LAEVNLDHPQFESILIIGNGGAGKTSSLASIHKVLRTKGLPTKIIFFDFDDDGALPFIRMAREGRELFTDKPGTVEPWTKDIQLFRYPIKRRKLSADATNPAPPRDANLAIDFMREFNQIDTWIDQRTGLWMPGKEVGAIILDPLTGISDIYEDYVWQLRKKEIGATDPKLAVTWTEWNLLGENIRNVYMTAKGFPCYVLCTGHLDQREEEVRGPQARHGTDNEPIVTGKWFYVPMLTKSLAMRISKDFSATLRATEDYKWVTRNDDHTKGVRTRGKDGLPSQIAQDLTLVLN
jgi:hypothetical protein